MLGARPGLPPAIWAAGRMADDARGAKPPHPGDDARGAKPLHPEGIRSGMTLREYVMRPGPTKNQNKEVGTCRGGQLSGQGRVPAVAATACML